MQTTLVSIGAAVKMEVGGIGYGPWIAIDLMQHKLDK
jgi:hypothetical protein